MLKPGGHVQGVAGLNGVQGGQQVASLELFDWALSKHGKQIRLHLAQNALCMAGRPLAALYLTGVPFKGNHFEGRRALCLRFLKLGMLRRVDALGEQCAGILAGLPCLGQSDALTAVLANSERVLLAVRALVLEAPDLQARGADFEVQALAVIELDRLVLGAGRLTLRVG
ncbi:hypothetical protein Q3H58_003564 [Pseudomonas psychrotolerans]|nr:hypothetical protein [Pseudomonas psychrotolerans]